MVYPDLMPETPQPPAPESAPFPKDFSDPKQTDAYFFANVDRAAKVLENDTAFKARAEEEDLSVSAYLNQTYTQHPEIGLQRVRQAIFTEQAQAAAQKLDQVPADETFQELLANFKDHPERAEQRVREILG